MSTPGAGHEFPSQEVSWLKRDALLFAYSIGCKADELHFLYVSSILYTLYQLHIFLTEVRTGAPSELCGLSHVSYNSSYV